MHILQVTNHGLHEWEITPGLPDTGGQNDQFEDIFENAVEGAETTTHDRTEKGKIQPLAHQVDGAEAKDNKSPENHEMQDTRP